MKTHYCNVSLPVIILFLLTSINSPLLGQFAGGSGTEEDPYLISTATHLANLAENVNADTNYSGVYFKLMSDIDLNISPYNENEGWEPIGNSTYPFQGNFNGNGYTINGLFINRSSDDQGLFGFIKDAVIKNLGLQYVDVTGSVSVGGLVGRADGSTITYCYSSGNVAGTNNVGGFIGIVNSAFPSYNVISDCYSRGSVSRISGTASGIAGFCGRSANRSKIIRSYSTSRVEWQDEPHPTDKGFVGITYGYFDDSEIIGSFWDIETSGQTRSAGEFDTSATGRKTAEMQAFGTFANAGWEFKIESIAGEEYIWNIGNNRNDGYPYFDWQYPDDPPLIPVFAGGDGTDNNPYQIFNHEHLNNVRYFLNDTTVHFILMSDINLTGKFDEEGVYNYGNSGWIPIGHSLNRFRGVFNGNGYAIIGLTINRSYAFQGLFGSIRNAEIANLILEDIEIIGDRYIGGFAGEVYGYSVISNCFSTGMVVGDWHVGGLAGTFIYSTLIASSSTVEVSGRYNVGGLIGEASWVVITNSSSSGSVNALQNYAGGILGRAYQSEISISYSTGEVSGGGNDVGGLVGIIGQSTHINNCYSTGNVSGQGRVGGMVGYAFTNSTINNSYSSGTVTASVGTAGGLLGSAFHSTANNSYWNIETSGQTTSAGGEGRTTDDMTYPYAENTYIDWNFTEIWAEDTDGIENNGYPYLQLQSQPIEENYSLFLAANPEDGGTVTGGGSYGEGNTVNVSASPAEGYAFINWTIGDEIVMDGENPAGMTFEYIMPAMNVSMTANFSFEFAGGSGMDEDPWQIATPYHLNNIRNYLGPQHSDKHFSQIADIDLDHSVLSNKSWYNEISGWQPIGNGSENFTGTYDGGLNKISNLFIYNEYTGFDDQYFGLFGYMGLNSELKNIILKDIDITVINIEYGTDFTGGLVGVNQAGTIINSSTHGSVSGYYTGGLAGVVSSGLITDSYSTAAVNTDQAGGGLVASLSNGFITNSYATGNITGRVYLGGLVGRVYASAGNEARVVNSYSTGNIEGLSSLGGLVAYTWNGDIINSYSTGKVTITGTVGTAGGLIGVLGGSATIVHSYWNMQTSDQTTSAGGEGRTTDDMTYPYAENTYIDWNFTEIWAEDADGIENNGYPYLQWQSIPVEQMYSLTLAANPIDGGTVEGAGVYGDGDTVQVTASSAEGYLFINWTIDEELVMDGDSAAGMVFEYIMPAMDITMIANFSVSPADIPVLVSPVDGTMHISVDTILVWNEADGADTYHVQLSTDPDFNTVKVDTSEIAATTLEINGLESLTTYYWRVCASNTGGMSSWSAVWSFTTYDVTSIVTFGAEIPNKFMLSQNYPNPFNPSTVIRYGLPERAFVNLTVYNSLGQNVATLINEELNAGFFEVTFDASHLPSGLYIYRLQAGEYVESKRMLYLK